MTYHSTRLLLLSIVILLLCRCAPAPVTVLVPQTVEVPVTVVHWQTVEIPITIVAVQTVEIPVIVEVVRTQIVAVEVPATVEVPVTAAPMAGPAETRTAVPPTQPAPQLPTPTVGTLAEPAVLPSGSQQYMAIAAAQNRELFKCLAELNHVSVEHVTAEQGRVAAVRAILESNPPPPELAQAHGLMLKACDQIGDGIGNLWRGRSGQQAFDYAYESNLQAEQILKQYAGG